MINTKNMKKGNSKRFKKIMIATGIILLLAILSMLAINEYVKRSVEDRILSPEEAARLDPDCILILGAGVLDNSRPSHMLEDRLLQGIGLYYDGASDRLLMSGDHGRKDYDEVNIMKNFARERGIPSEHIFMDHAGFSTYESMYRARDIFLVKKAVIVTQKYHMYRALYVAEKLGIEAYGVASDPRIYAGQDFREKREILARVKDFFTVIFQPEPTYLGETIPIGGNGDQTNDQ
jgi:vancomycin permeability regulator SanA